MRNDVVALYFSVDGNLPWSEAASERKGEEHGSAVCGVDGVVEFWS